MTTQIKITQLVDIGANLATSTVLPVVNMSGVPTTQKTNLGNVGNTILQGAGTTYKPAALANLAYSVANAAQPNITSVGTLTDLTVSGTTNLGDVSTIVIDGGTDGYVLQTDGAGNLSWTAQTGGGGGNGVPGGANTQVQFNDAGEFGGNSGFTFNKTAGSLASPKIDTADLYHLNGVTVENADLTHGATAAVIIPSNGNTSNPVQVTNTYGNVIVTTGINSGSLKNWTFDNTGNLTLPANTFAVNYANGQQVQIGSGGSTGNITFSGDDIASTNDIVNILGNNYAELQSNDTYMWVEDGEADIEINGNRWIFDSTNTLNLPTGSKIGPYGMGWTGFTTDGITQGALSLAVLSSNVDYQGQSLASIDLTSSNPDDTEGFVSITSGSPVNGTYQWQFSETGTTRFPTLTTDLHNGGTQSAQTLQFGDPNQQVIITGPTPDENVNAQRLIIQGQRGSGTGEGGDVYVWAGDAQTNGGDIKIYAGDADTSGYGGYINLDAGSGVDGGGQITITSGQSSNGSAGPIYITAGYSGNGAGAPVNINGGQSQLDAGAVNIAGGYGQQNGGNVVITGGQSALGLPGYGNVTIAAGASSMTFNNLGVLNVPSLISTNSGAANLVLAPQTGAGTSNISVPTFQDGGEQLQIINDYSSGNGTIIRSNGSDWHFGPDGTLYTPGSLVANTASPAPVISGFDSANFAGNVVANHILGFSNSYNQPSFIVPNHDDANWSYGSYSDGGSNFWMQAQFYGQNQATRGFRVLESEGNVVVFSVDGNGNASVDGNVLVSTNTGNLVFGTASATGSPGLSSTSSVTIVSDRAGTPKEWVFGTDGTFSGFGNISTSKNIFSNAITLKNTDDFAQIVFSNDGGSTNNGQIKVDGGTNMVVSAASNFYVKRAGSDRIAVTDTTSDFMASTNVVIYSNKAGTENTWNFNSAGNIVFPDATTQNTAWTGTVAVANVTGLGNIATANLDGNASNILYGNGSFAAAPSGGSYGNSNVATFLVSYGSNTITTTGNVSVGNLIGSLANGNSNVNIPSANGNVNISAVGNANVVVVTGTGANITGTVGASANITGANIVANSFVYSGTGVYRGAAGQVQVELSSGGVLWGGNLTLNTAVAYIKGSAGATILAMYANADARTYGGNLFVGSSNTGNIIGGNLTLLGTTTTGVNSVLAGPTFTPLANTMAGFVSNVNSYTQVTIQNKSTGTDATTDFVATADNGSDTVNYLDMGIINSGYDNGTPTNSLGNIVYAADSYLYAQGNVSNTSQAGGNLAIGTTIAGKNVKIFAGGANSDSIVANIANTGVTITGNLGVSGNISGNTNGYTIGYLNIPQVAASNTTLGATDGGKHYYSTTAGNLTLTIPNNATTSFATGTAISIVVQAAGNILVNASSGVTLYMAGNSTAANRYVGAYGMATLMKVGTDTWFINGTGVN